MKTYNLPKYGIKVIVGENSSSIESDLSDYLLDEHLSEEAHEIHKAIINVIEALVLAHASAGIDVGSDAYIEGLDTTMDAIANNM